MKRTQPTHTGPVLSNKKFKKDKNKHDKHDKGKIKFAHDLAAENFQKTLKTSPRPISNLSNPNICKLTPYYTSKFTYIKGRWLGKSLYQIFEKEFSCKITEEMIDRRNFRINGVKPSIHEIFDEKFLKNGMSIETTNHFHEKPVLDVDFSGDKNPRILYENEKYIAINKPHSIPIHPCGRYKYNSIQYILSLQRNFSYFRTINRLDALTSGICFLAKNQEIVDTISRELANGISSRKFYLTRVIGEFPFENLDCQRNIHFDHKKCAGKVVFDGSGQLARTIFKKLHVSESLINHKNGQNKQVKVKTTVISCELKTGRTHQIRIHLQSLGFPILNDPIYNNKKWGKMRFRDRETCKNEKELKVPDKDNTFEGHKVVNGLEIYPSSKCKPSTSSTNHFDPSCYSCQEPLPDPHLDSLVLYLHCHKCTLFEQTFQTDVPDWAEKVENFKIPEFYWDRYLADYEK